MTEKILVALKSRDRLSRMLPYVEDMAKPGMKVVFLIPFGPQIGFSVPRDNLPLTVEEAKFFGNQETKLIHRAQPIEEQKQLAEHKVFLAIEKLLKKGIDVKVDVYTGSLRSVLKNYTVKGNVHLVMKRAGKALMMIQFFCRTVPNFILLQRPRFSPVRMLRTNHAV
jgi:hypothetical protein